MGRIRVQPGSIGEVNHEILISGKWTSERTLKRRGETPPKGAERRARAMYRTLSGEQKNLYASGGSRASCETVLLAKVRDVRDDDEACATKLRGPRAPLSIYVERWVEQLENRSLPRVYAQRTIDTYSGVARKHVIPSELAAKSVDDITRNDLFAELASLSSGVRRHVVSIWRSAWDLADGDIPGNPPQSPLDGLKMPRAETGSGANVGRQGRAHRDRVYSPAEIDKLLRRLDEDSYAISSGARDIIGLAVETGARINELNSLRWADIDLETEPPSLTFAGQIVRRKGEGLEWTPVLKSAISHRTIPLTHPAVDVLERRLDMMKTRQQVGIATRADEVFVFPTPRRHGMPDQDAMKKSLRRSFDAAGHPEMTLHSIRRMVERRLEEAGLSRMDRESIMGHTVQVAERHYSTHGVPERGLEALGRPEARSRGESKV